MSEGRSHLFRRNFLRLTVVGGGALAAINYLKNRPIIQAAFGSRENFPRHEIFELTPQEIHKIYLEIFQKYNLLTEDYAKKVIKELSTFANLFVSAEQRDEFFPTCLNFFKTIEIACQAANLDFRLTTAVMRNSAWNIDRYEDDKQDVLRSTNEDIEISKFQILTEFWRELNERLGTDLDSRSKAIVSGMKTHPSFLDKISLKVAQKMAKRLPSFWEIIRFYGPITLLFQDLQPEVYARAIVQLITEEKNPFFHQYFRDHHPQLLIKANELLTSRLKVERARLALEESVDIYLKSYGQQLFEQMKEKPLDFFEKFGVSATPDDWQVTNPTVMWSKTMLANSHRASAKQGDKIALQRLEEMILTEDRETLAQACLEQGLEEIFKIAAQATAKHFTSDLMHPAINPSNDPSLATKSFISNQIHHPDFFSDLENCFPENEQHKLALAAVKDKHQQLIKTSKQFEDQENIFSKLLGKAEQDMTFQAIANVMAVNYLHSFGKKQFGDLKGNIIDLPMHIFLTMLIREVPSTNIIGQHDGRFAHNSHYDYRYDDPQYILKVFARIWKEIEALDKDYQNHTFITLINNNFFGNFFYSGEIPENFENDHKKLEYLRHYYLTMFDATPGWSIAFMNGNELAREMFNSAYEKTFEERPSS
ncbi:MAG: hypothetical protein PVJ09_01835 [Candidatus Woesebacteria bacterium]|jgi:hypothetical protein